ncbi:MAG: hypothetical protein QME64_07320, partial [bacterium]|nr:hypothetical protein [bacterium]
MRIAINTLPLLDNIAGSERYVKNILTYISRINSDHEYYLILSNINQQHYRIDNDRFTNIVYKGNTRIRTIRIFGEQIYIPLIIKPLKIDVFFSPCNVSPIYISPPVVLTLFDLQWLVFPELFSKHHLMYIKKL